MNKAQSALQFIDEEQLSFELIEAQYLLKSTRGQNNAKSVVVLVNGIELAGKGESVKQLREWVDPRYLHVHASKPQALLEQQSFWQPYAPVIPVEGEILLLFGNWYSDLLYTAMHTANSIDDSMFDQYIQSMRAFEQDLKNNHVDVVKIWIDLSWKTLQKRLDGMDESALYWHQLHALDWRNKKQYEALQRLRQRFTQDWLIIDGEETKQRDQAFAQAILQHLKDCPVHESTVATGWKQAKIPTSLLKIDQQVLNQDEYKPQLKKLSLKVAKALRAEQRNVVIVFEGMDAAGKGGAIKRIIKQLDPREYEINTIAAPEKYELHRPYLWRFWTKLPKDGNICIFDRSWYGRVLVERIEGFANAVQWQRAYDEINRFEADLVAHGTIVIKFWLAISKEQQEARFKAREATAHKHFKITEEDWRNRSHWDDYLNAAADMFARTNTATAPWHVVATDDKKTARIQVLAAILKQLSDD